MITLHSTVDGIFVGSQKTIGPNNTATGIYKDFTDSSFLTSLGLEGDIQVDRRVHGGAEKALYHYPAENYSILKEALPPFADQFIPGSIGENISTSGFSDNDIHIGDIAKIGNALVQVSQPRRPCWKVNHKYGNAYISSLLISQAISGWYYRVIEEGQIEVGDTFELQERLENSVTVAKICEVFMEKMTNKKFPADFIADVPGLSSEWSFE